MLLQIVAIVFLFIIIAMMFYLSSQTGDLGTDIKNIDIPECPSCPSCPSCPACPSQCKGDSSLNDKLGKLTEKMDEKMDGKTGDNCPECPVCETKGYPTVEEIVSGIFPGRNMGLTRGGQFFPVNAESNYELLPEYNYYDATQAFPETSLLDQAMTGGPIINQDSLQFDNSFENTDIDTTMSMGLSSKPRPGNNLGITNDKSSDVIIAEEIVEGEVVENGVGQGDIDTVGGTVATSIGDTDEIMIP
tara:strand:+ start:68 stop:805 length:738 start_codon:yes stop_codon:yes gene_type:complete